MDRRAELLNIRDIRDLEMAKICINQKRNHDWWNVYQTQIDKLSKGNFKQLRTINNEAKAAQEMTAGLIIGGSLILIAVLWLLGNGEIIGPLIIGSIGGVLVWFFSDGYFDTLNAIDEEEKNIKWNEQAEKDNISERARIKANQPKVIQLKKEQQKQDEFWAAELVKVNDLLDAAYKINVIPKPYRYNFAAIQYIYEYMATSQVSLEHVLLATKIEEGIQRIEAKLNIIIAQQQEIIFQMRCQEAQNKRVVEQNKQMINSLRRTERNTLDAAQYSQLTASYSKTCAFFAIANYLDNK